MLDETSKRPKAFDLAGYWAESMKRFERDLYTGEATVRATRARLKGLSQLGTAVATAVAAASMATSTTKARVKLRVPIESIEHATGPLLRLSPEVEVLEPAALRASIVSRPEQGASLYGLAPPRR